MAEKGKNHAAATDICPPVGSPRQKNLLYYPSERKVEAMTLGQRIAAERKKQDLSQEKLGELLGVSRQAVSKWETDAASPDMENLRALSNLFGISLSQLTDTPPASQPRKRWPLLLAIALAAAVVLLLLSRTVSAPPSAPPPPEEPGPTETVPPEPTDVNQQVYIAFNRLVTGKSSLTAEEQYTLRWTVFSGLSDLNWGTFGALGSTASPEDTMIALLTWLGEQTPYSESEIFRIQMGCQSNPDGWLADSYAHLLATALFDDPIAFVKGLSHDGLEDCMSQAVSLARYDAELYPIEREAAVQTLEEASQANTFTDPQTQWAQVLLQNLTAPEGTPYDQLPHTPADL